MRRLRSDSGAAAVEFALVLIPLILILMGIIDFGRVYSQQLTITSAAREGARVAAVQNDEGSATGVIEAAASGSQVAFSYEWVGPPPPPVSPLTHCVAGANVKVRVTYLLTSMTGAGSMTGIFSPLMKDRNLVGEAVMRCGG